MSSTTRSINVHANSEFNSHCGSERSADVERNLEVVRPVLPRKWNIQCDQWKQDKSLLISGVWKNFKRQRLPRKGGEEDIASSQGREVAPRPTSGVTSVMNTPVAGSGFSRVVLAEEKKIVENPTPVASMVRNVAPVVPEQVAVSRPRPIGDGPKKFYPFRGALHAQEDADKFAAAVAHVAGVGLALIPKLVTKLTNTNLITILNYSKLTIDELRTRYPKLVSEYIKDIGSEVSDTEISKNSEDGKIEESKQVIEIDTDISRIEELENLLDKSRIDNEELSTNYYELSMDRNKFREKNSELEIELKIVRNELKLVRDENEKMILKKKEKSKKRKEQNVINKNLIKEIGNRDREKNGGKGGKGSKTGESRRDRKRARINKVNDSRNIIDYGDMSSNNNSGVSSTNNSDYGSKIKESDISDLVSTMVNAYDGSMDGQVSSDVVGSGEYTCYTDGDVNTVSISDSGSTISTPMYNPYVRQKYHI